MKRLIKVFCVLMILLGMVSCSSKSADSVKMSITENKSEEIAMQDTKEAPAGDQLVDINLVNTLNRKVIKKGNIIAETKEFNHTINEILKEVENIGGFIQSSTIEGNSLYHEGGRQRAEIVVRIPEKEFDNFINGSSKFGNVISKSVEGEDITDSYVDTKARLKSLNVQRDRLMELLEKSGSLEDLFAIEKELANVNYEIEKLQGTLNQYDSLVNFSTVNISIEEVIIYKDTQKSVTLIERIESAFKNSCKALIRMGEEGIIFITASVPYLVIFIPIIIIAIVVIKKVSKK